MAIIETLSVALTARTQKFTSSFAKAQKTISAFAKRAASLTARIGGLGLAIVGIAGVAGLVGFVNAQREAIDEAAKFADVVGISTEALAGYQLQAKLAGVDQSVLNKGLLRFQKTVADSNSGLSTAKRVFENLGLDSATLSTLSMDEAIKRVADRLPQLANQFTRVQVAQDLFGARGGAAFLKFLEEGSAGIDKFQAEARKLGLSFNRVDAAKVEAANDAITRMQELFVGVGRTLTIELAPFIEAFAQKFVDMGVAGEGAGMRIVKAFEAVVGVIVKVINGISFATGLWFGFKGTVEKVAGAVAQVLGGMSERIVKALSKIPGLGDLANEPNFVLDFGKRLSDQSVKSFAAMEDAFDRFDANTLGGRVDKFFGDITARANEAARKATSKAPGTFEAPAVANAKKDPFAARGIDLGNVFVGALNQSKKQEQRVQDRGLYTRLDRTNELLRNMQGGGVLTV